MPNLTKRIVSKFFTPSSEEDKYIFKGIKAITGKRPYNLYLYKLAMKHTSMARVNAYGLKESNERLEYLGDSILGMIVAEFLFTRFPFKDEGFLTEIRSKIVNRESLNNLAKKIGLGNLIDYQQHNKNLTPKSMFGDSLEALIGAVYLDKGFGFCRKFILTKLLSPHFDLEDLINTITNHKSRIIEWGQKENKTIVFDMVENENNQKLRQFVAQIVIDGIPYEKGFGPSKKKAEQDAARKTLEHLEVSNQ